ncbi:MULTISPECIES: CBS domain-containing protein [Kosmotoga]|jgi:acetoin utilization protein AcuB|uniref:CBS domain containing protein n=1 Tax=Kosmotoga olearia (strain ATCC BAA-1733 / DSM 21960 / TBF 19.5.1) TaxID=521045 RepID=C5CGT7_KOSOT|nr:MULTISPECIES: CBS domain-containing protein [Kosmotoga]ACR80606.1 CBS domain containing protein [Kosmotoga olearia TBF 19.5.1]MDI3523263.1 acetoin utilization protein AcuB [Kosmotoga sp.]MDK2952807.1 acetoin utilization protein AcuB [Kosmotoga sp.]OAA19472.1 hypothetical protein DU53_10505 [Kosmotoga sp. DU53]
MFVKKWINRAYPTFNKKDTVGKVLEECETYEVAVVVAHDDEGKLAGMTRASKLMNEDPGKPIKELLEEPAYYCYAEDYIEDAILLLIESHDFVIPVVSHDMKLKGVLTVFDILEALMEFTAMDQKGSRISLLLDDKPGVLKKVVDVLAEKEINILSIVTSPEGESKKRVIIRTDETNLKEIVEVLQSNNISFETVTEEEGFCA